MKTCFPWRMLTWLIRNRRRSKENARYLQIPAGRCKHPPRTETLCALRNGCMKGLLGFSVTIPPSPTGEHSPLDSCEPEPSEREARIIENTFFQPNVGPSASSRDDDRFETLYIPARWDHANLGVGSLEYYGNTRGAREIREWRTCVGCHLLGQIERKHRTVHWYSTLNTAFWEAAFEVSSMCVTNDHPISHTHVARLRLWHCS